MLQDPVTKTSEVKMSVEIAALLKLGRRGIREMFFDATNENILAKDKDSFEKFKNLHEDAPLLFNIFALNFFYLFSSFHPSC